MQTRFGQKRSGSSEPIKYVWLLLFCGVMAQPGLMKKALAEEDKSPSKEAVPKDAPSKEALPLVVEGTGFEIVEFKTGTPAFSNRAYEWYGASELLNGCQYTKVAGGGRASITVRTQQLAYVYIATAAPRVEGWEQAEWLHFKYNDKGYTQMYVYRRAVPPNTDVTIPQQGWTGAIVLAPRLELKAEAPAEKE